MKKLIKNIESMILNKKLSNQQIAFFLLFMNIVTSSAVSIYIPCMRQMATDLNATSNLMQMTIVSHLIGEFVGRVFFGPFVGIKRTNSIIIPSLLLSILGHLGCFLAKNLYFFIGSRFLQALGASIIYIVSLNIINELFSEKEKASVIGILELYQPIAWILSPFVGAILSEIGHWRLSFLVLMIAQIIGLLFFLICPHKTQKIKNKHFSISKLFHDYGLVLRDLYFIIYALIPGLFAGGYMIFSTNCPFICAKLIGNNSANIAIFSTIPLLFYVISTFIYRIVVKKSGIKLSKWIGTSIYIFFGLYISYLIYYQPQWNAEHLLYLMCIQCMGSAFLVPVSILKALQSISCTSSVGASTVVIFRNIVMSLCISLSSKFVGSITTIMACVFMTVATVLFLITTRKIIKIRKKKKSLKNKN